MKNQKASDVKKGIAALWETLQCPICLDLMTMPISTKCDHQFCKFCIMKLLDGSKQSKANCPVCKAKITKRSLQESPGFQKLVTGLQDMIQAYEYDTGINYFTGQQKGDSRFTNVETIENPCNILTGNTFDTNLDQREHKDNDVPLKSSSSTVEAQNGFAKVMGLEDSAPFTTENEGLDSGLGDAPPTFDKKMLSLPDNLEPEMTDVREKATHRSRSKKSAKLENTSLCAAPAQEETEQRLLRTSSRMKRKTDLESDKILEQRKKKSLEKVAEWLMKVPAEADLELEKPPEKADDLDSSSSTSTLDVEPHNFELNPRKDHVKALEEQVFGAVYKRRSNKGAAAEVLTHKRISTLRKKKCTAIAKKQQMIENKDDTSSDFLKEVGQMKVGHKHDMSKNVKEFNQLSVNYENEKEHCPVSDIVQQQLEPVTKKITCKTVQQVDGDLQEQAQANSQSAERKNAVRSNGKNMRLEKKQLNKRAKPLLVGVQNRETSPRARDGSEEVQVQIENYTSSEDKESSVLRRTRRSKRLQLCVEEVQETVKICLPKKDINITKPSEVTKGERLNLAPTESRNIKQTAKTNGCVYDQDIGGIESLETGEKTFTMAQVEKEIPHAETLSEAVAESRASVLSNSTSVTDVSVVAPTFENDNPTNSPPNEVQQEPLLIEAKCAQTENKDNANDSELDTEQLLRSFKATKRKSFHLGDTNLKRSRLSDKNVVHEIEAEDDIETSQKQTCREILEGSKNAVKSSCSDPLSNSLIQGKTTVYQPDQTVVEASIPNSSCSGQDNATGNCLSSGLSPNKVLKLDRESPSLSVVPQIVDSGLRFTAVEPEELSEASKSSQVTEGQLEFNKVVETNPNEHNLNAESSLTPNDLMAPALQSAYKTASSCSAEVSTHSSIKSNLRNKRRAQKLESSSESDSSGSKEELPTLTQLFGTSTHPPAIIEDRGGSGKDKRCESVGDKTDGAEPPKHPPTCPSPDCINSSQASVDLFGTPDECGVPENDTGVSMESSQFSSEVLVTQQKIEMQKELVRLGKLISLVSEVLQEKESSPVREGPLETNQGNENTSSHRTLLCEQKTDQASCRKSIPDVEQGPSMRPSEEKGVTEASQSKHGDVTGMELAVKDTKIAEIPTLTSAAKTTECFGSPSDGQEDKENNSPPTERRNVKLVLVSSGLGSAEQVLVKKFAKRIGARVVSQVTPEVTHIIMRTNEQLVCERTLKYFLGIAGRKWVVSFQWISECFKQKKLLGESPFEVRGDVVNGPNHQGPSRARNTEASNLLMKGYKICFQGPFTDMSTDELEWMVELCGAAVVKDPLLLDSKQKTHQLVIVQPRPESSSSTYSGLSKNATVVTRGWLLDTVATYTLQNFNNYTT